MRANIILLSFLSSDKTKKFTTLAKKVVAKMYFFNFAMSDDVSRHSALVRSRVPGPVVQNTRAHVCTHVSA